MAIYGIIALIYSLMRKLWNRMEGLQQIENMKMVLIIKDQEEVIEGIIRNFYMSRSLNYKLSPGLYPCYGISGNKGIIVVDMGSTDKTSEILQKLKNTYGSLEVLSMDEKDKIFEGI